MSIIDGSADPSRFRDASRGHLVARFAPQSNQLVPEKEVTLQGKTQVLQRNDDLFRTYMGVSGVADGETQVGGLSHIENEHVRVVSHESRDPLVAVDSHGKLTGDPKTIQSFVAATKTYDMHARNLGRDFQWVGEKDQLAIRPERDDAFTAASSAFYTRDYSVDTCRGDAVTRLGNENSFDTPTVSFAKGFDGGAADPDAVSHETGHAVLDSQRPALWQNNDPRAVAMHEAFADGTAMMNSLNEPEVLEDMVAARRAGRQSTIASNIGEGVYRSVFGDIDRKTGMRDVASGEGPGERRGSDPYTISLRYTKGLHDSLGDVSDQIARQDPSLSDREAMMKARDVVGKDFSRSVDFLPAGGGAGVEDLAMATIKADKIDNGGSYSAILQKRFQDAGVDIASVEAGFRAREEHTASLRGDPSLVLPGTLKQGEGFVISGVLDKDRMTAINQKTRAEAYLSTNRDRLGIQDDAKYGAHHVYHNDRGETFIHYTDGNQLYDVNAKNHVVLGFDQEGRLIHVDGTNLVVGAGTAAASRRPRG